MLFALEWIRETYQTIADAVWRFIGGITLPVMETALSRELWVMIPCALAGLILCFSGFKRHKLVNGLTGGVLLGWLGWYVGAFINSSLITVPILYTFIMSISGFSLLYIVYVLNVFSASFLLAWASCAALPGFSPGYRLFAAFAFGSLYCILYTQKTEIMTALTGGILLGLIAAGRLGVLPGAVVCAVCTAAGILVQTVRKQRSDERKAAESLAEQKKYPFGPGERDKMKAAWLEQQRASRTAPQGAAEQGEGERA